MKIKYLKIFICVVGIFIFSNVSYALTGNEIIDNKDGNIIKSNRDVDPNNNIIEYPFYSKNAKYLDLNGNTRTSDGWQTGVAYGYGLRETIEVFNEKLGKKKVDGSGYLAGLLDEKNDPEGIKKTPWFKFYTGLDCSGFVANAIGLPYISNGSANPLWIWHPSAEHLMSDLFSEEISWEELVKGDILVKKSHIALVIGKPLGDKVDVIESAIRWDNGYVSKVISKNNLYPYHFS